MNLIPDQTRSELLQHPFWKAIETSSASSLQLRTFALQDYWLIRHSPELESLLIENAPAEILPVLRVKCQTKEHAEHPLFSFGAAFGLDASDFEQVQPLAGCAALITCFYYAFARGGFLALLASVSASESIFIDICRQVTPFLQKNYSLTDEQVRFFSFHDELLTSVEQELRYVASCSDQALIAEIIDLTLASEKLFYDTVFSVSA